MKIKNVSIEAQSLVKKLGIIEADFTSYYDEFMDIQLERLDDERSVQSFELFLELRIMAKQFIQRGRYVGFNSKMGA